METCDAEVLFNKGDLYKSINKRAMIVPAHWGSVKNSQEYMLDTFIISTKPLKSQDVIKVMPIEAYRLIDGETNPYWCFVSIGHGEIHNLTEVQMYRRKIKQFLETTSKIIAKLDVVATESLLKELFTDV